jgi:hypothetical protein
MTKKTISQARRAGDLLPGDVHKFAPPTPTPQKAGVGGRDSQRRVYLLPSKRDALTKTLTITVPQWRAALKLCSLGGYTPPEDGGMTRESCLWFLRGLRTAVERGHVAEKDQPMVEKLIRFCDSEGRMGFTFEQMWKGPHG